MRATATSAALVVVLVIGLLAAALPSGATAGQVQSDNRDGQGASGFIVVLDSGDPNEAAAEHSQRHNAEVSHVYTTALRGYAAQMSEQAAEQVARDDRVAYVDRDREVRALHHKCGHDGGPSDGGDPCDGHVVSGTVTDADSEEGIGGATVTLEETGQSDTTGDEGTYRITDVAAGDYTATADADDYEPQSENITVDGEDVEGADFTLSASSDDGGGGSGDDDTGTQTLPWGVERIGANNVHSDHTGTEVSVYVIDSGIQADHPDLADNLGEGHAVVECHKTGGETCAADWDDDHGHGTHVGGTAAATDNDEGVVGVAPEATLHAVKVLDRRGRGWTSDIIAGIEWIAERESGTDDDPAVANMSLGGSGSKDGRCDENGYDGSDSYYQAICEATQEAVVFAVAAGNSDEDASGTVPAAYKDTVMTLSATTCDLFGAEEDQDCAEGSDGWADFSNHGDAITVGAPGEDVLSTWIDDGYHVGSGTSMASPHAAGAAALLIDAGEVTGPGYEAFTQTQRTIVNSAEETDDWPDDDGEHDEGFLDVDGALSGS